CFDKKENRDRSVTITEEMIIEAAENLIQRRETHLDSWTGFRIFSGCILRSGFKALITRKQVPSCYYRLFCKGLSMAGEESRGNMASEDYGRTTSFFGPMARTAGSSL
ncbi:MAG: hypothetical protein JXJ04_10325, partial [Spirochaetales bacterium]|nr:hypothetical protein [Spirochaetales bacterium]